MASAEKSTNPFYLVLLVVGVLFVLTACSYFVMTVQARDAGLGHTANVSQQRFLDLLERYGFAALMIELGLLGVATFAAIGTDEYWSRRAAKRSLAVDRAELESTTGDPQEQET